MEALLSGPLVILVMIGAVVLVVRTLAGGGGGSGHSRGGALGKLIPRRTLVRSLAGLPLGFAYAEVAAWVVHVYIGKDTFAQVFLQVFIFAVAAGVAAGRAGVPASAPLSILALIAAVTSVLFAEAHPWEPAGTRWWLVAALVVMYLSVLSVFYLGTAGGMLTVGLSRVAATGWIVAFGFTEVLLYLFSTGRVTALVDRTSGRIWLIHAIAGVGALIGFAFRAVARADSVGRTDFTGIALSALGLGMVVLSSQALWFNVWWYDYGDEAGGWVLRLLVALFFAVPYALVRPRPRLTMT